MSTAAQRTLPATRRTRKSIGAHTDIPKTLDKENATMDGGSSLAASRKKSRSKSLGPGGLDALKQGHGNRRASLAAPARPPRSILKPTIAPLPEIPPLKKRGLRASGSESNTSGSQTDDSLGSKIALRTEEEQQAAAREREEKDRRDARRKSLANRRVSFAAEATLHTFHEVDYAHDSTASTDASRRASAAANNAAASASASDDQKSTPQQHQGLDELENHQNELESQQRKFDQRDDDTATTLYSSDSEPADVVEEEIVEDDDGSSSDSDDGTMMSVVTEEVTGTSMGSDRTGIYDEAQEDSSTLDEALRLAAHRAGNQRLAEEESSDEDEDEEVIPSFGWIKKGNQNGGNPERLSLAPAQDTTVQTDGGTEMDMDMDMDMTNAVGGIIKHKDVGGSDQDEDDMSMDVTRVLGGIIDRSKTSQQAQMPAEQDDTPMDEVTMEFTTAIGRIQRSEPDDADELDDNEDMSMELTTVMGSVLGQKRRKSVGTSRRRTANRLSEGGDVTMDMTTAIGAIVSTADAAETTMAEDDGDATMGMDITTAIGGILNHRPESSRDSSQNKVQEQAGKASNFTHAAATVQQSSGSPKAVSPARSSRNLDNVGDSPSTFAFGGNSLRRSTRPKAAATEDFGMDSRTPSPQKPATPKSVIQSGKKATPRSQRGSLRSSSPKRPSSRQPTVTTPTPAEGSRRNSSVFQTDRETGTRTPTVILTPQQRKLTGVGVDKTGLGSPRVAALFDRRSSIGDSATKFIPGQRAVSFADPKDISDEVDNERQLEQDKENSRRILEREADGSQEDRDATLNLREMIDSLSPKRKMLKGRKSLHVGSARGLLGKRPFELDDEDAEPNDGVKRLKGHQSSPVKNIRLRNPLSKAEITGRVEEPTLRATRNGTILSSPVKSPKHQLRFKEVDDDPIAQDDYDGTPTKDADQLEREAADGQIHLQDFLNLTSIRFMELTTTKRRHTAAPSSFKDGTLLDGEDDLSLERCVVTGACTVPTLELYQHSCRELKKYISEGRRIVKEIETDTFEENPPLFQEYLSATADVKALMDNQFKNVKTHARLLSKAMWYEWRMKLQDGLKEGLVRIVEGMGEDEKVLQEQQDLLNSVVPSLTERHRAMLEEAEMLEEVAKELADCDPAELRSTRDELARIDNDIAEKKKLMAELKEQFEHSSADVEVLTSRKQSHLNDISESEKIREECRGWTSAEIDTFKVRVNKIERTHGWVVTGISGTSISMTYKREVELVFDIAAFQPHKPNASIDLWYIADGREVKPIPRSPIHDFVLACIRDQIRSVPQSQTPVAKLLSMVQASWDKAALLTLEISKVNIVFPTAVSRISDSAIAITSSLLLVPLETRVETVLKLHNRSGTEDLELDIAAEARVIYGEHFNVGKVGEFLTTRIGNTLGAGTEEWGDVMVELHQRLIARGRKQ